MQVASEDLDKPKSVFKGIENEQYMSLQNFLQFYIVFDWCCCVHMQ